MKPIPINWIVEVLALKHVANARIPDADICVRAIIADLEMLGIVNPAGLEKSKGDKYLQQEKKNADL